MTLSLNHLGLSPFLRLVTTSIMAGWVGSPMSWSPDGEWLSYTVASHGDHDQLQPGWLFRTSTTASEKTEPGQTTPTLAVPAPVYRIWATQRDNRSSVPIEESHSPLTAPAWSPRGKVVAFGRFVPQSIEPAQAVQRGRYEVVIQDGLDRKQVVWSTGEIGLDAPGRASLPELSCAWSPDGQFLAIPRPGTEPTVEVVRTDNKKHVATLDHASCRCGRRTVPS